MPSDELKARTRANYNLASDHFDDPALAFWRRVGERTVERLELAPGNRVLDVCCGSGATAIPAAHAVGRFGTVLGVDLAENLLRLARDKATVAGLQNVRFRREDIETMRFPAASCDAVICQFGIFFLPDMEAAMRRLWSLVAPGGVIGITTWGPRVLEPVLGYFWEAVANERPDLVRASSPCERISAPSQLGRLFTDAGVAEAEVVEEFSVQPLVRSTDAWSIILGTGTPRGTIAALEPEVAERVRDAVLRLVELDGIREVEINVIHGVARRPQAPPKMRA
ncbi:MAG: class I SAM-dependent methyltransferase [Candidatus Dormibacteria bacterium]